MPKFRKKPVIVDAQQWWPPGDARHDPSMLSHRKGNTVTPGDYRQTGDIYCFAEGMSRGYGGDIYFIRVGGPNDNVTIAPGDWIITGAKGEKYPCKPDIFAASYDPVNEPPPPDSPPHRDEGQRDDGTFEITCEPP